MTLEERRALCSPPASEVDDARAAEHRATWLAKLGGSEALLAQRLALAAWPEADALRHLGEVELPAGVALPAWTGVVEEVIHAARDHAGQSALASTASAGLPWPAFDRPAPAASQEHAAFALPWLEVARRRLHARCPEWTHVVDPAAQASCVAALASRLLAAARDTLAVEHAIFQAGQATAHLPWLSGVAAKGTERSSASAAM
ncbi:MAG: hypothetical protein V4773_25110, partial [Verrucomicrobiota bacterium]